MSSPGTYLDKWESVVNDQSNLFRAVLTDNEQLREKMAEVEHKLRLYKDNYDLNGAKIQNLEKDLSAFKKADDIVVCLIDGDGNIFTEELITLGYSGGKQAAMLLNKGINDTLAGDFGRAKLWVQVYLNQNGLAETLASRKLCTVAQFDDFVVGFNQSSPLFSIVDVGSGKEAADAKIKECLRVFTRFPQTGKVFFGGGHDNGYTTILNELENEGLLDKIFLLRGYADLAREIKNFNLPVADIEGIFMTKKIGAPPHPFHLKKAAAHTHSMPNVKAATAGAGTDRGRTTSAKTDSAQGSGDSPRSESPVKNGSSPVNNDRVTTGDRYLDPTIPMSKHKPPPCNNYYLDTKRGCSAGVNCRYGHNYILTVDQLKELTLNARKTPCPSLNKNKHCPEGGACIHGHFCPKGPSCPYLKRGNCKFVGANMHNVTATPGGGKKNRKRAASFAGNASPGAGASPARMPTTPGRQTGFGASAQRTPSPQYDAGGDSDAYPSFDALRDAVDQNANVVIDYSPPMSPSALAGAAPPFSHLAPFAQLHPWRYPAGYESTQRQ